MANLAVADEGVSAAPGRFRAILAAPAAVFAAERERHVLWLPVSFGAGIALYFALTSEPPRWLGLTTALAAAALTVLLRHRPASRNIAIVFGFAAAGFAVIQQARVEHGTPMLERRLGSVALTGKVIDIDAQERGWRIIIAPDPLPDLVPGAQPHRLRIHIPPSSDALRPGDRVSLRARLYPAPAQVLPGGRDMQRELFFAGIGGVGYSFGAARRATPPDEETAADWREWLLQLRADMTRRINEALPGSTGGVASAVITGKRGAITEEVKQAFRESGLSHLLAIAGLHLGLVGGFVFFAVRGGLALIPYIALRYPIRSVAACLSVIHLAPRCITSI